MLLAVDTGGTKTLVAAFSDDGQITESVKFPTPSDQAEYLETLIKVLTTISAGQSVEAIVVALPGIINNGVAVWCNNLGWRNFDVQTPLAAAFAGVRLLVDNDANLAGLAETRALDPTPQSSLYVTVSTGIGTGVITNGRIDPGLSKSEGGRSLVEYDGIVREWESFASGQAIYKTYGKYARDITSEKTWQAIADRISRGFLAIIPFIQPDVIIIGGSMGTYFNRYAAQLTAILREKLPDHIPCPAIQAAAHPEEAVVYGCYYYALDENAISAT